MFLFIALIVMTSAATLAFPPLAIITVPLIWILLERKAKQAKELRRQRDVFIGHMSEQQHLKALRAF